MNKLTPTREVPRSGRYEIDLADFMRSLWRGRLIIVICVIVSILLTALYLHTATYRYTVELKVTSTTTTGTSLSGSLGQLGQVAALAGIGIANDQNASAFQLYLEGLTLRETAEALSKNQQFMKVIYNREWDETLGRWEEPAPGPLQPIFDGLRRLFGAPIYAWQPPDAGRLHEYIKRSVKTVQNVRSPVATITFKHQDPQFAMAFLTALNDVVDSALRQQMLARTSQYIAYLSQTLRTVTIAEHRLALAQALSEQERLRMTASSSVPYAAAVFGRPTASVRPTEPWPSRVLMVMLLAGLVIGSLLARVMYAGDASIPRAATDVPLKAGM